MATSELNLRAVQVLLRCVQSPDERFRVSAALADFCRQYENVGTVRHAHIELSGDDKERICTILRSEGIDPATPPTAWTGKSRSDALALGRNEKLATAAVMRRRIAIKALREDAALWINDAPLHLPSGCHLDADFLSIDVSRHDWLVVVENWETFDHVERTVAHLAFPGSNPLIVWRGAADTIRADAILTWIKTLHQPVAAFVDLDPKGLVIAATLPRLERVVAPPLDKMQQLLKKGLADRYSIQLPGSKPFLDSCHDEMIEPLWKAMEPIGRAFPQEYFLRPRLPA